MMELVVFQGRDPWALYERPGSTPGGRTISYREHALPSQEDVRKLRTSLLNVGGSGRFTTEDATQTGLAGEQRSDSRVVANR